MSEVLILEPGTKVQIAGLNMLVEEFKWRDARGNFHHIDDMETRHLFHVVRMIWDHSMPAHWQTDFRKRYRFPEFYSQDYMALAVRLMLPVVLLRPDLTPNMRYWLNFMRNCLLKPPTEIPFVRKIAYHE